MDNKLLVHAKHEESGGGNHSYNHTFVLSIFWPALQNIDQLCISSYNISSVSVGFCLYLLIAMISPREINLPRVQQGVLASHR